MAMSPILMLILYIISIKMGDIAIQKVVNQLYGDSEAGTVQLIHYSTVTANLEPYN
jgi:hypothetical protein